MSQAPADSIVPSTATPSPYGDPEADPDMAPDVPNPEAGIPELPHPVAI